MSDNPFIGDPDFPTKERKNVTQRIAFGYIPSLEDPLVLIPDPDLSPYIKEAFDFIDDGGPFRTAAQWLTEKCGRSISHQGVKRIWQERRGDPKTNPRAKSMQKQAKSRKPKTSAERKKAEIKTKLSQAKRLQTINQKKLDNWLEKDEWEAQYKADKEDRPIEDIRDEMIAAKEADEPSPEPVAPPKPDKQPAKASPSLPDDLDVVFRPNPGPQTEFLAAPEREVLFGGSAGGGKSYAMLADPMRYFDNKNFAGILFRRTNDELRELIWKSQEIYPRAFPGAKWQEKKSQWVFPSGARLWLTYLERDEDVLRYQGQAFSWIGFDEITQYPTPFAFDYMRSRLRSTDPSLPLSVRATTNPGGPGHGWVKRMFIDPSPPNTAFPAKDINTGENLIYPPTHEKAGQPLFYRRFIPASLYDNPYLSNDGAYEANLLALPEMQRRQLLEGDWAIADGAAFPEFRPHSHVVEPFEIPDTWRRFRSCDYGYSSYSAVHWFAIDPAYETLVVYRELYVSKHTGKDLAKAVLEQERGERIDYGVLDSSCWHQRGQVGPSIAEEMIAMGCRWRPSDRTNGARINGKNRFHEVLKIDEETGTPGIVFFNNCRQIIADLPVIPADPRGGEDINPKYASDHAYDSVRYGIMSRPRAFSPFDDGRGVPKQRWRPAVPAFGY